MTTHVHQFLCLKDNYGVLIHDSGSGATAAIDAADADAIIAAAAAQGWELTDLLVTHHHFDHVQGIPGLRARFPNLRVAGPPRKRRASVRSIRARRRRLRSMSGPSPPRLSRRRATPPATSSIGSSEDELVFTGDTLFSLGCGRVFEAPYSVMWDSLVKLAALPGETEVYCGHEYTEANARFALTIEPDNAVLKSRADEVAALRAAGQPTLPTTMAAELAANPFLRAELPSLQAALGMAGVDPAAVFAEIRARKDRF